MQFDGFDWVFDTDPETGRLIVVPVDDRVQTGAAEPPWGRLVPTEDLNQDPEFNRARRAKTLAHTVT